LPALHVVHVTARELFAEGHDVELSRATANVLSGDADALYVTDSRSLRRSRVDGDPVAAPPEEFVATASARRMRRLIVDQRYFGLAARVFHAGAERMLERISAQAPGPSNIDLDSLGIDFRLEREERAALLSAMLVGGLLAPDGSGYYQPTTRFREYALAPLVAPLSRARAKILIDAVREVAAQINTSWSRNPFEIKTVSVTGSYMSRSDQLPELSLWVVLRRRREKHSRRWRPMASKADGLRQILAAVNGPSSFIVARIVAHRSVVPRPFCVVFQASDVVDTGTSASQLFRDLGTSIHDLLSAGSYSSSRRGGRGKSG
jgi:hypothetical protein